VLEKKNNIIIYMILLNKFISIFEDNPSVKTFNMFLKNTNVILYNKTTINLYQYITQKNIILDDVQQLYYHIINKNKYLTSFYNVSLKVPDSIKITEPPMKKSHINNNKLVKYKNLIRNMFFWEILKNTKSGLGFPTFLDVLDDLYNKNRIDYRLLTPSAIHYLKQGRIGSVFSSFYFRASIMNPFLVYSLNKSVFHGSRIFTPTMGWGSYFYGFAESGILEYTGVDVIPSVCNRMRQFSKKYYPNIKSEFICCPSEQLATNQPFLKKTQQMFDVVFFSPPYFKMELYEGKQQSTNNYPDYESWLLNYWEKTIMLCRNVLIQNGILCYILSDYGSQPTGVQQKYSLIKDMNLITKKYFAYKGFVPMFNKNSNMTTHHETSEKIMFFVKL
jgi:hypothetical protein